MNKCRRFKITLHIQHFNYQLTHTTLKNVELLKHFKTSKYGAITLTTYCTVSTYLLLTKCVIFS